MTSDRGQLAGQLERNLRFLPSAATRDGRLALLTSIGDEQVQLGRLREACALAEELVDRRALVGNLLVLARCLSALNRLDEAEQSLREADLLCRERLVGERHDEVLEELGRVLAAAGDRPAARLLLDRALSLRVARGDRVGAVAIEKLVGTWGDVDGGGSRELRDHDPDRGDDQPERLGEAAAR